MWKPSYFADADNRRVNYKDSNAGSWANRTYTYEPGAPSVEILILTFGVPIDPKRRALLFLCPQRQQLPLPRT